ncbi:leucine carboxyl methyltransferase 1 [Brachionus plicatilis]|uniref:Leucine carboxyl methyltransferase 1 n=1 Tax=Brachionus plicatilis TaxID=10195 RepID=A0A3M7Q148_BRAPC|nr:leucine carboxyl methyltransferase 1 [Brachionus plicatilis]
MSSDEAIQLTNNDASFCKSYAISKGYWSDPYLKHFCGTHSSEHKPPEISRGYFARVNAIRSRVYKFIELFDNAQVINLGAGYDTLFFDLTDKNFNFKKYIEIDFPRIVSSKIRLIRTKRALWDKIPRPDVQEAGNNEDRGQDDFKVPSLFARPDPVHPSLKSNSEIHLDNYDLISADLRNPNDLDSKLKACGVNFNYPTLVIAECVLIYMSMEHSSNLLKYLTQNFDQVGFVNYEQCNLADKFGDIMMANMEARECRLQGTEACSNLDSQLERFLSNGFVNTCTQVITMSEFYTTKMDRSERHRIEAIEFLDETELLFQLMDHYCVGIAANSELFRKIFF